MNTFPPLTIVNFGHPLTDQQRTRIEMLAATTIERVIDVPTHLDDQQSFAPQVAALVASVGLTATDWQTLPLLVNLPSYAPIVAVLLAHLHGLCGHFPTVIHLRPVAAAPPRFEVAELVGLQGIRNSGRTLR